MGDHLRTVALGVPPRLSAGFARLKKSIEFPGSGAISLRPREVPALPGRPRKGPLGAAPALEEEVKIKLIAVDSRVYRLDNSRLVSAEGYSSGQRGQTVNLLAMPT